MLRAVAQIIVVVYKSWNFEMKWQYYPLPAGDERAMAQFTLNLRCGDRTLGKRLYALCHRVSNAVELVPKPPT
jgi:hypothetical protein